MRTRTPPPNLRKFLSKPEFSIHGLHMQVFSFSEKWRREGGSNSQGLLTPPPFQDGSLPIRISLHLAESAGFEPAELLHPLRFERSTLNHSDNFPLERVLEACPVRTFRILHLRVMESNRHAGDSNSCSMRKYLSSEMVRWVGVEPTSEESQSSILAVELPKGFGGSDDWIRTNEPPRMRRV